MKLKVIIVDDEKHCRDVLVKLLKSYFPEIEIIAEAEGVVQGFRYISEKDPDIIFLDVEMQDGNGFDLMEKLPFGRYKVIFTTGHSKYAAQAFQYSAIDYLLKPIELNVLKSAIDKAQSANYLSGMSKKIETLLSNKKKGFEKIALPCHDGIEMVKINQILRCESDSNYTRFYFANGDNMLITKVLKEYEHLLEPHGFFRVHKSHLVNLNFVRKYVDGEGGYLIMEDGSNVSVSRRRKKELVELLLK